MKELYQALAEAQKHISTLEKSAKGNRSKYVKCDDVVFAAREALLGAGLLPLIIDPRLEEMATEPDQETGELVRQLVITRKLRIVHLETGQSLDLDQRWPVVQGRRMPLDHATAAADSFGLTYLFRGLLLFERGDEDDRRTHGEPPLRTRPAPKPSPEPAPVIESAALKLDAAKVAKTLKNAGIDSNLADNLEAAYEDEAIPRGMIRDLFKAAKDHVKDPEGLFRSFGVVPGSKNIVSGQKAVEIALTATGGI